jgi:palmitoyltransferase
VNVGDVGDVEAFRRRQREDWFERSGRAEHPDKDETKTGFRRMSRLSDVSDSDSDDYESEVEEGIDGEEGWTNAEGDRLRDFGVDEDAELLAEDEIPLGELLRRRKARVFT